VNKVKLAEGLSLAMQTGVTGHALENEKRISVVSAAPGSGKSTALLEIARTLLSEADSHRILIAAQTNNQATDLAIKLKKKHKNLRVARLVSSRLEQPEEFTGDWLTSSDQLPDDEKSIVIGTTAKLAQALKQLVKIQVDFLLVDEAFQMSWAAFMQLSSLSSNFVLIGDGGQIDPVVTVDTGRWESSKFPPHWPAPNTVALRKSALGEKYKETQLNYCWRLPRNSVEYIKPFYEQLALEVLPVPAADERVLTFTTKAPNVDSTLQNALELSRDGSPVLVTIPDETNGTPVNADKALAKEIAAALRQLLDSNPTWEMKDNPDNPLGVLKLDDIAICSTKRAMNAMIEHEIQAVIKDSPQKLRNPKTASLPNFGLKVDTPERLQGLEFKVFLAVHPLSSATNPSAFDLETGRLCVMASRHQLALIMFSREHVLTSLDMQLPNAIQAPGMKDNVGIGHRLHRQFLKSLTENQRVIRKS
jgi:hypothetical protein